MRALHELAHHRHGLQRLEDAEQLLTQALDLAEELDDQDAELQLLISFAAMLVGGGRTSVADGILERAARLASALGNQVVAARVLDTRGRIAMLRDHPQEASASFSDALKLSQQFGIHGSAAFSLLHLASCHLHSGAMKEASACFNQAFDLACRSGDPMAIATSGTGSMRYGGRGCRDLAHARKVLDEMRRLHRVNSPVLQAGIEIAESIVLGMHGSLRESIELLDLAESRCRSPHFSYHAGKHRIRLLAHLGMIREAGEMSQAFELSACGRLKAFTIGAARHLQGLVQHFDGRDTEAAEHLAQALAVIPPSLERQEALLDAIWLDLDAGRREQWSRRVAELGDFLAAAVSSDFAPALLVQARLHCEAGDAAQATAMQRRYCEVLGCDEQSLAAQVLAAYRRRHESGDSAPIPRLKALPSLYDIAPGM